MYECSDNSWEAGEDTVLRDNHCPMKCDRFKNWSENGGHHSKRHQKQEKALPVWRSAQSYRVEVWWNHQLKAARAGERFPTEWRSYRVKRKNAVAMTTLESLTSPLLVKLRTRHGDVQAKKWKRSFTKEQHKNGLNISRNIWWSSKYCEKTFERTSRQACFEINVNCEIKTRATKRIWSTKLGYK